MTAPSAHDSSFNKPGISRTDDPAADSLQRHLSESILFARGMLEYNLSIRAIIGRPKTAVYAAAGADLSGFHSTIHAEDVLFVCDYQNHLMLKGALIRLRNEGEVLLDSGIPEEYSTQKRIEGYAPYYHLNSERNLAVALISELKACGGQLVDLCVTDEVPVLQYTLPADDQDVKRSSHRVFFLHKKLQDLTRDDIRTTIGSRIDVYHHRAAMELPSHYEALSQDIFPMILHLMPPEGVFVTDDIGIDSFYNTWVDFAFSFPEVASGHYKLALIGQQPDDSLIPARLVSSIEGRYGRCLRIRRKVKDDSLSGLQLPQAQVNETL
jgi:hypothetical protein